MIGSSRPNIACWDQLQANTDSARRTFSTRLMIRSFRRCPRRDKDLTFDAPRYQSFTWEAFRRRRGAGDYEDLGEEVQISHYRVPD